MPRPSLRVLPVTATLTLLALLWRLPGGASAVRHLAGAAPEEPGP